MANDLVARATVAYLRSDADSAIVSQPSMTISDVVTHAGLQYVILRNVDGVLAVYRVRTDNGLLRRMKRWPAELCG
jgi:hypothetical protein